MQIYDPLDDATGELCAMSWEEWIWLLGFQNLKDEVLSCLAEIQHNASSKIHSFAIWKTAKNFSCCYWSTVYIDGRMRCTAKWDLNVSFTFSSILSNAVSSQTFSNQTQWAKTHAGTLVCNQEEKFEAGCDLSPGVCGSVLAALITNPEWPWLPPLLWPNCGRRIPANKALEKLLWSQSEQEATLEEAMGGDLHTANREQSIPPNPTTPQKQKAQKTPNSFTNTQPSILWEKSPISWIRCA